MVFFEIWQLKVTGIFLGRNKQDQILLKRTYMNSY